MSCQDFLLCYSRKDQKEETSHSFENAKVEVKKPFAFEEELKEKTDRLNALNIELNLDEKDPLPLIPSQNRA